MTKGWTWEEVRTWARMHYGEVWWAEREALIRANPEMGDAVNQSERGKRIRKAGKRWRPLRDFQFARDEEMLTAGKTWHEIMSQPTKLPVATGIQPSVKTQPTVEISTADGYEDEVPPPYSPSTSSELSMGGGFSTFPPTPTSAFVRAKNGSLSTRENDDLYWERAAKKKAEMLDQNRSQREDDECELKRKQDWQAIAALKWDHPFRYYEQKDLFNQRAREKDLRQKGCTQEWIDAVTSDGRVMTPRELPSMYMAVSQDELAAIFASWDFAGISKERQAELVDVFQLMTVPEPGPEPEQLAVAAVPEQMALVAVQKKLAPAVPESSPYLGPNRSKRIAGKVPEASRLSLGTVTHSTVGRPNVGSKRRSKRVGVVKGGKPTGISKAVKDGATRAKRATGHSKA
ncbi:hypothetical protein B0J13DRAFT_618184 [Dactylonectria estremocensis]|uniref:Uncharacterized protein n=1 Tax=Dactylonectria estremocensis TaxID=1079267 RepID=A0A9P9FCL9_9HYPO|nr:hypothetical protein B0J13DRAFT_618184 [Dactylonectria estremocensis]